MSSAICLNLDQSKILFSSNGLMVKKPNPFKNELSHALAKRGLVHLRYALILARHCLILCP